MSKHKVNSIFISDIHLGTKGCKSKKLFNFLSEYQSDNLYLVGDIVDIWAMKRGLYWPQSHNDIVKLLLKKSRQKTKVIYIIGNHDETFREFIPGEFGNIKIENKVIHTSADGKQYIVMHGDQFDVIVQNKKYLAILGSWAYDTLLWMNSYLELIQLKLKLKPWSISRFAKAKAKAVMNYIGNFEDTALEYAKSEGVNGIICGHIHHPIVKQVNESFYINCGDWVESCSAIIEHSNGTFELVTFS